ncbi:MAG: 16S rRNA (uracil(1498)-N(3))-methyltransferase [Firmicutes bacterium]|nr:16S rRNA (uracil(1498)-N(3))-methyltransferase [Bacillota bacterium]
MNRFFYRSAQRENNIVRLEGEDAHHLIRVLRADVGDKIELCDEQGVCQLAEITAITKHEVLCILGENLPNNETEAVIDLAFGLLKGEKTDFILQKTTELGVHALFPFISRRTVARPEKKLEKRQQRWQKIVDAAAAQAKRSYIPKVYTPSYWPELIQQFAAYEQVVVFWEKETKQSLKDVLSHLNTKTRILLITGPEGGLDREEVEAAAAAGAKTVTLGPRILRAETAAMTAVALTMYEAGEMRR